MSRKWPILKPSRTSFPSLRTRVSGNLRVSWTSTAFVGSTSPRPSRSNGMKINVVKAFTPDFYLPDLDLFIELTTMKQSLVTKKNRKVRLLRELYPDVNIKILYERDYKNLIWKYGIGSGEKNNGNGDERIGIERRENE